MYQVSKPSITEREISYATDAIASGWISSKGPYIERFEKAWANYNKMGYGVSCNSGTNALFLALKALGIKEGDEVIVPEFTMIATAWAVSYCGATPVFVDCKKDLTVDPVLIEEKITPRTRAIIPVHVYGKQCDMDAIMSLAHDYNLYVVEDSAEAHGVIPRGDIACFSFFGNKIITTGEGGMCVTNDKRLAEQMQHLKSMAFDANHTFLHKKIGYNHRMTNVQAAIGLAQVERIDEILAKRRQIQLWYEKYLPWSKKERDVLWMYDIARGNRDILMKKLFEKGVDTRYFFKPMSQQPMYKGECKNTWAYSASMNGLYLPTYTDMTEEDVRKICEVVDSCM